MPPRKRAVSKTTEDEAIFYHIVVTDGENNSIRFGPFTMAEILDEDDEHTFGGLAEALRVDIHNEGLEQSLTDLGLWGGLTVRLVGDDKHRVELCQIPIDESYKKST